MVQLDPQPSPLMRLPSSHASSMAHAPSPHVLTHVSLLWPFSPPVQAKPCSV